MYNFIFDSDSLIKLANSGALNAVCKSFNCVTTDNIKRETVDEGKKRLYHDADIIEGLLKSKLLKIRNPKKTVEQEENLGDGEMSVLALSKETGDHIVVSDDRAFIKKLEEENQSYHVPLDLIALLKKLGKISQNDAMKYLEKIKIFVREADYTKIKKELEEK